MRNEVNKMYDHYTNFSLEAKVFRMKIVRIENKQDSFYRKLADRQTDRH